MTAEVKEVFKRLQKSPGVSGVRIVMMMMMMLMIMISAVNDYSVVQSRRRPLLVTIYRAFSW